MIKPIPLILGAVLILTTPASGKKTAIANTWTRGGAMRLTITPNVDSPFSTSPPPVNYITPQDTIFKNHLKLIMYYPTGEELFENIDSLLPLSLQMPSIELMNINLKFAFMQMDTLIALEDFNQEIIAQGKWSEYKIYDLKPGQRKRIKLKNVAESKLIVLYYEIYGAENEELYCRYFHGYELEEL